MAATDLGLCGSYCSRQLEDNCNVVVCFLHDLRHMCLHLCSFLTRLHVGLQAQNGSLFPSAVVSLYCSYLCYSALQSEPHSYQCNGLGKHFTAASGSTLAVGMVIAIVSVVYSALRAGSNNRTFKAAREEAVEEGLLETETEGTSAGLDGEPTGQSMGGFAVKSVVVQFDVHMPCEASHPACTVALASSVLTANFTSAVFGQAANFFHLQL